MDKLLKTINQYPNKTKLLIQWHDGRKIEGQIDTIYETNNGIDEKDKNYKEFYSCVFEISKINEVVTDWKIGELIDVSMEDTPSRIQLSDGTIIWDDMN